MKLLRFRVTDFRSVEDSGWIDLDKVTALIGVNESGKTNLLLPLWKLNPAYEGQIRPNADYPKQNFGEIRSAPDKYCFITADFSVEKNIKEIAEKSNISDGWAGRLQVRRFYDGHHEISFYNDKDKILDVTIDDDTKSMIVSRLPRFVYYSNYGNLDSEIYLPHVVDNLERTDLGSKEEARARTLRVLFSFVKLEPKEILELGRDFKDPNTPNREPTPDEVAAISEKKRERSNLLQGASALLTREFKAWWKQGDYRFRFEADGNHFRIWVSDDLRPEEVELEGRSSGLQWFLSFYLVFLVESLGAHKHAILLLDEPGLSLHPLAQRDLSAFFEGLSETNQIIYTTHSPFLVDADRLERARKVYVDKAGKTKATADLRYRVGDPKEVGAGYAVYSALNLSVSESLLFGCQPIIVEGQSDQHYLTMIKAILIGAKKISPIRELVFPPAGGAKTARIVASILTGRDETLPIILLDGDGPGQSMAKQLVSGLYAAAKEKILNTNEFAGYSNSEIEDLIPTRLLAHVIDRWERRPEKPFAEVVKTGQPIVPQIERWAEQNELELPKSWKVDIAKLTKQKALNRTVKFDDATIEKWVKLFKAFERKSPSS